MTILRDKDSRKSKGVAFIQYKAKEHSRKCVSEVNNKEVNVNGKRVQFRKLLILLWPIHSQMFGRTIKASMAKDNGKSGEYQERKTYSSNQFCFECQQEGHVSYKCPKNVLGIRDPPTTRKRKAAKESNPPRIKAQVGEGEDNWEEDEQGSSKSYQNADGERCPVKRISYSKNSYFSDEEEEVCE